MAPTAVGRAARDGVSFLGARGAPRLSRSITGSPGRDERWGSGGHVGAPGMRGRPFRGLQPDSMREMPNDAYGLPVSTGDPEALALYDRAVRALQAWQADALALFRAATERDPGLALAHAGAAVCLFLEERFPETKAATEAARAAVVGASERERSHVAALTAWTSGQVPQAERLMREHLAAWPRDAMVFQRLYYVYFWLG